MFGCVNKNQDVIKMIPSSLVSHSLKKDFIKSRGELMKRSFITESQNKMIREWTLPRMLLIAQEEERNEKEMKKQLDKARGKESVVASPAATVRSANSYGSRTKEYN